MQDYLFKNELTFFGDILKKKKISSFFSLRAHIGLKGIKSS